MTAQVSTEPIGLPLLRPPGRHLGDRTPAQAYVDRELRRAVDPTPVWHVILWTGVDLITECEAYLRVLLEQGLVRVMVTVDRQGARVEVTP